MTIHGLTDIERALLHVDIPDPDVAGDNACWLWRNHTRFGYAQFTIKGEEGKKRRTVRAHRFVYEKLVGPIPEGLDLDHLCCVKHCVRPSHLEPVTHLENIERAVERRRLANEEAANEADDSEQVVGVPSRPRQPRTPRTLQQGPWAHVHPSSMGSWQDPN